MNLSLHIAGNYERVDYLGFPLLIPIICLKGYLAMDSDGTIYIYETQPKYMSNGWACSNEDEELYMAMDIDNYPMLCLDEVSNKGLRNSVRELAPQSCVKISDLPRL